MLSSFAECSGIATWLVVTNTDSRPGAEVLGTHVHKYIFEVQLYSYSYNVCVMFSYSYSMYSDLMTTLKVHMSTFSIYVVKIYLFVVNKMKLS